MSNLIFTVSEAEAWEQRQAELQEEQQERMGVRQKQLDKEEGASRDRLREAVFNHCYFSPRVASLVPSNKRGEMDFTKAISYYAGPWETKLAEGVLVRMAMDRNRERIWEGLRRWGCWDDATYRGTPIMPWLGA